MTVAPFIENVLLVLFVAPVGAGVLSILSCLVQGWKRALRGWWYMTLLFVAIGVVAALPTLLTGQRFGGDSPCSGAIFGYACY